MNCKTLVCVVLGFLFVVIFNQSGFAEEPYARIYVQPLYEPGRYGGDAYASGYEGYYCMPPGFQVGLYFLNPRHESISLTVIHSGGSFNAGSYTRPLTASAWHKYISRNGARGSVKVIAVVRPDSSHPEVPTLRLESNTLFFDLQAPRLKSFEFRNIRGRPKGSGSSFRSPVVAVFKGVRDDVPWNKFTYKVMIDGEDPAHISYTNSLRISIPEGRHDYGYNVIDGCNRAYGWKWGKIIIDNTPPSLSMSKPAADQKVFSGSWVTIETTVADMLSGVRSVKIYVDSTRNKSAGSMKGPWMVGFGKKETCKIKLMNPGKRRIYAVALDRAGNQKRVSRQVQVIRRGMVKKLIK